MQNGAIYFATLVVPRIHSGVTKGPRGGYEIIGAHTGAKMRPDEICHVPKKIAKFCLLL